MKLVLTESELLTRFILEGNDRKIIDGIVRYYYHPIIERVNEIYTGSFFLRQEDHALILLQLLRLGIVGVAIQNTTIYQAIENTAYLTTSAIDEFRLDVQFKMVL